MRKIQKEWRDFTANSPTLLFWAKVFLNFYQLQVLIRLAAAFVIPSTISGEGILEALIHGLVQDLSASAYLCGSFYIVAYSTLLFPQRVKSFWAAFWWFAITLYVLIVGIADTAIMHYWGTHLNQQALAYLSYPKQLLSSIPIWLLVMAGFLILAIGSLSMVYFRRTFMGIQTALVKRTAQNMVVNLVLIMLLIITIRGGIGKIPLSLTQSLKSRDDKVNLLATNAFWNVNYLLFSAPQYPDMAHFLDKSFHNKEFVKRYRSRGIQDSSSLKSDWKPKNLIIVVLEGVSAQTSKLLGGTHYDGLPLLDSWAKQYGRFSRHCYATGDRTDKGIASVFSAWPGHPWQGILHEPERFRHLPHLMRHFKTKNFKTRFYYGGDADFVNTRYYMLQGGADVVFDKATLRNLKHKGNWGYHDSEVLMQVYRDLSGEELPYFSSVLTLSSHEPYDVNSQKSVNETQAYYQSVSYVDRSLNAFLNACFNDPSFDETCFIIVSDHGKYLNSPETYFGQREFFRIPFFILGKHIQKTVPDILDLCMSQSDIYNSVLDLYFGESDKKATYSRSIFRTRHPQNAVFHMDEVCGIIQKDRMEWLSVKKQEINAKRPLNDRDSAILAVESEIISDFFQLK